MVPLVLVFASNILATDALPAGAVQRLGSPQFRHGTEIVSSALSPDGKLLATAGTRTVIVWDVETGSRAHTFPSIGVNGNQTNAAHFCFSPTGKRLAVQRSGLQVWELDTGRLVWDSCKTNLYPRWCRFGATDNDLFTGALVSEGNPATWRQKVETRRLPTGDVVAVRDCDPAWDYGCIQRGGRFAFHFDKAADSFRILEWGVDRNLFVTASPDDWWGAAISPDGSCIARVNRKGQLDLLPTKGGLVIGIQLPDSLRSKNQDGSVWWSGIPEFSEDGREVWLRHQRNAGQFGPFAPALLPVYRWNAKTGEPLPPLTGLAFGVVAIHYPLDGKAILSTEGNGMIRRWHRATGISIGSSPNSGGYPAFSSDMSTFASAGNGQFTVVDTRSGASEAFPWKRNEICGFALSPTGMTAAIGCKYDITLLDTVTGRARSVLSSQPWRLQPWIWSLRFSPNGRYLAAYGPRQHGIGTLTVWDTMQEKLVNSWEEENLLAVFTADGKGLASWVRRQSFQLLDTRTGKTRYEAEVLSPNPNMLVAPWVDVLAVSPDGRLIAAGYQSGPVVVQDISAARLVCRMPVFPYTSSEGFGGMGPTPKDYPTALAFSADSKWIAVGTSTHAVEVWEVASGQRLLHFEGHDTAVRVVQFAPDGRTLWSAGNDGLAYRWDVLPRSRAPREWGQVWARLTKGEPSSVPATLREIVDDPSGAASFLRKMYQPPTRRDRERIAALIQELGDEEFAVREVAEEDIFSFGLAALAPLQAASRDPNPERSVRVARVLRRLAPEERAASLRAGRIATALELAGTPEARGLLAEWSKIAPDEYLGAEAKAATERLLRSSR